MNKELVDYLNNLVILYAEDDSDARAAVEGYLDLLFGEIFVAQNGQEAWEMFERNDIDVILTDIDMPGMSGLDLTKKIREKNREIPIIIMTAHTKTEYLLEAVELGLAKYIVKPFVGDDFLKVLEKTFLSQQKEIVLIEGMVYDYANKELRAGQEHTALTRKECALLELLINRKNRLVPYDEIEDQVWGRFDEVMSPDSLRALVKSLRKKIPKDLIKNVSGMGYKLEI